MKTINIDYISDDFSGVGISVDDNRKYFIDNVLERELVEIVEHKNFKKYGVVTKYNIIKKSNVRCEPECEYFDRCGGCSLQYMCNEYYYNKKLEILSNKLKKVCSDVPDISLFKVGKSKRRKINLKYKSGCSGFFEKNSNNIVKIAKCINVCDEINNFLPVLDKLDNIDNLKSLDLSKLKNGLLLNFIFSQKSKKETLNKIKELSKTENLVQISYQENDSKKSKILLQKSKPILELGNFDIELPSKFFMQASDASQNFIIDTVLNELKYYQNVLDLYSGIGTYSFPLSKFCNVYSFENDTNMVKNMNSNIQRLNIKNIKAKIRDLNKKPLNIEEFDNFDAIIINPPRTGAKSQCEILSKTKMKKIIYISCNPDSLVLDMSYLLKNYKLRKVFLVDQFYWSKHIECICVFE